MQVRCVTPLLRHYIFLALTHRYTCLTHYTLNSLKTPHTSPSWATLGTSVVSNGELLQLDPLYFRYMGSQEQNYLLLYQSPANDKCINEGQFFTWFQVFCPWQSRKKTEKFHSCYLFWHHPYLVSYVYTVILESLLFELFELHQLAVICRVTHLHGNILVILKI